MSIKFVFQSLYHCQLLSSLQLHFNHNQNRYLYDHTQCKLQQNSHFIVRCIDLLLFAKHSRTMQNLILVNSRELLNANPTGQSCKPWDVFWTSWHVLGLGLGLLYIYCIYILIFVYIQTNSQLITLANDTKCTTKM